MQQNLLPLGLFLLCAACATTPEYHPPPPALTKQEVDNRLPSERARAADILLVDAGDEHHPKRCQVAGINLRTGQVELKMIVELDGQSLGVDFRGSLISFSCDRSGHAYAVLEKPPMAESLPTAGEYAAAFLDPD